jgi:hypothetical protein
VEKKTPNSSPFVVIDRFFITSSIREKHEGFGMRNMAEPPRLFQLKCPSHALKAATHLNRNNPSVLRI